MASVTIEKDRLLFEAGKPANELFLIMKGSVSVSFPGGEYTLTKGDVPGICDLCNDVHFMTCKTLEDSVIMSYPVYDISTLQSFFRTTPDSSILFARSAFRQVNSVLQCYEKVRFSCSELYNACMKDYSFYNVCCMRHQISAQKLPGLSELAPCVEESPLEDWAVSYYDGFEYLLSANRDSAVLAKAPAVPLGLIINIVPDFERVISAINSLMEYQKQVLSLYLNKDGNDLFGFYIALYENSDAGSSDFRLLQTSIAQMLQRLKAFSGIDQELYAKRSAGIQAVLKAKPAGREEPSEEETVVDSSFLEQLTDSLQTILSYSGAEEAFCSQFKELINRYQHMEDKSASDDSARRLRQQITSSFYELYNFIFFKASKDSAVPLPVRMFLYFGYVDELLAGTENTAYLGQLADRLSKESYPHTFTLYDWLNAILKGEREPSRNEFDEDYTKYLHTMKVSGKISAQEETEYADDTSKKVEYELKNMMPPVNKMTSGRISTFCPVFSAHNVLKTLDSCLVSNNTLQASLTYNISLDFTAYYREYVYTNVEANIPKEFFHMEKLPDFILMPGVGTRGVMWQEIEGRRRNTSARMMLPMFYMDDLRSAIVRLTGEYRWEMCKRIQGPRWNDMSERSLTSEYFDYIQFYKKNNELSPAAKEKIKTALQKSRGSFKEMFVKDYISYILFEGTGSPRLTKIARTILFTYCPFAKPVRSALAGNPIFKDLMERYDVRQKQQIHRIDMLKKRVENSGSDVPQELQDELNYLNY